MRIKIFYLAVILDLFVCMDFVDSIAFFFSLFSFFFFVWLCGWRLEISFSILFFLDDTQPDTSAYRSLDEKSSCRSCPYRTKHNTKERQTSLHPVGFEWDRIFWDLSVLWAAPILLNNSCIFSETNSTSISKNLICPDAHSHRIVYENQAANASCHKSCAGT